MTSQRDNLKAGIFVVGGVVLALVIIFALTDFQRLFRPMQQVTVRYHLSDGLKGLKEGAAVTLGGQPVGEVVALQDEEESPGQVVGKIVTVRIPKRVMIYQNAVFELDKPPFGSGTKLNIRYVGDGEPYQPGQPIPGDIARSELTEQFVQNMGIEDQQREQIRQIIANLEVMTTRMRDDLPQLTSKLNLAMDKIGPVLDNAVAATDDIKVLTADLRQRRGEWFDGIERIVASADDALARVRTLLEDKDPQLRTTIDNVADVTAHVREKTLAQVDDALSKAQTSLENLRVATGDLRTFVTGQRPVLERAMANAQLTTDQLKLAAIEIRRSPWRLLYKPGDKELETDNLYDAARSFALAAGTLDAAALSLQAVVAEQPGDQARINRMLEELEKLFSRYEEAEAAFWDALKDRTPPR